MPCSWLPCEVDSEQSDALLSCAVWPAASETAAGARDTACETSHAATAGAAIAFTNAKAATSVVRRRIDAVTSQRVVDEELSPVLDTTTIPAGLPSEEYP